MVEAVVEYDYTAQEPDELTIQKGDVIRNIVQKKGGWWEGTLRDKRGMFPDNFVTVIHKDHKVAVRAKPGRVRQCRAIFSYHPAHDDELSLSVGDVIDIVCEVEEGWWKGRLGSLEGVFPSNFVAELGADKCQSKAGSREDLPSLAGETDGASPSLPPKPTRVVCQVKYPYDACNDDELSLREGDLIALISKDGQDRGWWRGELRGRIGVFPDNFVTVLPASLDHQNGPEPSRTEKKAEQRSTHKHLLLAADEPSVACQRKSLEAKAEDHKAPPVPGKKPHVPKKAAVPAMAGLKQKLVDLVDGQAGSRQQGRPVAAEDAEAEFDRVERSAMLPDMRAHRARAPGRRPPSAVYREAEPPALVNGDTEHTQPDTSNDEDETDRKPRVREWERHKAPWVEELKLNQAKRTPPLTPGSGEHARLKLTPTSDTDETKVRSSPFAHDKDSSPVDMSRSLSALGTTTTTAAATSSTGSKLKTPTASEPPTDKSPTGAAVRAKVATSPAGGGTPARPQSIHGVTNHAEAHRPTNTSPSPAAKPPVADKATLDGKCSPRPSADKKEMVTVRQHQELQDRLQQVEARMQQQLQDMQAAIRELEGRLQVETDMRRLLQAELEKVAQCVTQV